MSFTAAQKVKIRRYLGFPLGFYDLNTRFESMLDTVGSDANAQAEVESVLAELATIDAVIASGANSTSSMGSLKAVDEISWYNTTTESNTSSTDALGRGKMLINRLAAIFGFKTAELESNYFATASGGGGGAMALG